MFYLPPQRCVQLQLWRPSRAQDACLAQAGRPERLEIYIMRRPTPSHQDCSTPLGARWRFSRKLHALRQEPAIPRHPRHTKTRHEDVTHHATSHTFPHTLPEPRGDQLTRREPPVKAYSDARPGCSPPPVRKKCMPLHLYQEGGRNSDKGVNKYKITKTLPQIPPTPKPYLPPDLGKSAERLAVRANTVGFF